MMVCIVGYLLTRQGVENGNKVLVHCQMGQSRSAAVVTAYLMYKQNLTFEQAFKHVKSKRTIVSSEKFETQLREFEATLNDGR